MNANRARRRWLKWCRYVDRTQTIPAGKWGSGVHAGQAKAFEGVMYAQRYYPKGLRPVWYPRWGNAK